MLIAVLAVSIFWGCKSTQDVPSTTSPSPTASVKEDATTTAQDKTTKFALKDPVPFDEDARMGMLNNGMRYYIRKNGTPENYAEVRLAVNTGSITEDDDQQGLAHFVEHMCFNGTKNFPKNELVDYLESIGTKFGAHLNAYTSFDETVYMLRVPTDSAIQFATGLQIMEDWAHNVVFEGEEIDKERGVVIEEWRLRLGANNRMNQKTFPITFYNSQYAKRLPIGKEEILKTFEYETLRRYYKDWYRPDLMALVVVGDVNPDEVEKMVKEKFGSIPKSDSPKLRKEYEVPDHADTKVAIVTDPEATRSMVTLDFKHPPTRINTLADYRSSLVSRLCNMMLDARLEELINSENPPFSFAFTGYGGMVRNKDSYSSAAFVPTGGHMEALRALVAENERAARFGFTASELERAKRSYLSQLEQALKEKDKTDSRRLVNRYVYHFLNNNPAISAETQFEIAQEFMPTLSLTETSNRFKSWIIDENRVIVLNGPEKEGVEMPTEAEVLEVVNSMDQLELEPYEDEVVREPLFSARPEGGEIASKKTIDNIGVTEIQFKNGARVILKPTDFQAGQLSLNAFSPGGHSNVPDAKYHSATMASQIISSSGVGPYDATQMEKFLSDKTIRLRPYISELEEGFSGSSSVKDQEVFLQMLNLYFTAPRKDKVAFDAIMGRQKTFMENMLSDPSNYYYSERSKFMYGDHLRRQYPSMETMNAVNLDDAYDIYKDRFADISDFTFIIVGNMDMEEFTPLLASYIGSIPAKNREESWKDVGANLKLGVHEQKIYKGREPKSSVNMIYHGEMEWNIQNRYELNSMVQVLSIMLRESLREEKGGVYGVRVSADPDRIPSQKFSVNISFGCAPENAEDLIERAKQDIKKLQQEGASEKNLQKIKETQRKEIEVGTKENSYWLNQLNFSYQNELDPSKLGNSSGRIDKLTAEDIRKAAMQYLSGENYMQFLLYPEAQPAD